MIAFRGLGGEGAWSNVGDPITPPFPTSWQHNDFALLAYGTHSTIDSPLVTEPAGWTLLPVGIATGVGGSVQLRLYWRRLQGGDVEPTLEDNDTVPHSHHAHITAWSGVSLAANPVDVFGTFQVNSNNGSTSNAPSITPTAGDRAVLVCGANASLTTATSVSGTPAATERADVEDVDTPSGPESTVWEFSNSFDGATGTGTRTVTWFAGGSRVSVQLSLRPESTARSLASTSTGSPSLARVATHVRALVATGGSSATLARARTVLRALAALASALASMVPTFIPGGGVTYQRTLATSAVGVARLSAARTLPILARAVYRSLRMVAAFKGRKP